MTQIELEELKKLNPIDKLNKAAIKEFGTTSNFLEVGYIKHDGKLLDFSGKKEGGTPGMRSYDHREVCRAINTKGKGISGDKCMDFFERQGNVRFGMVNSRDPSVNISLNTFQTPTEKQTQRMRQAIAVCRRFGPCSLAYDVYHDDGRRCEDEFVDDASQRDVEKILTSLKKCKLNKE